MKTFRHGKIGAVAGCVIGQHEANKVCAIGSKDSGLLDERRSSLTVKNYKCSDASDDASNNWKRRNRVRQLRGK